MAKAKPKKKRTPPNPGLGGKALVAQRGPEYMAELGRKSAKSRGPEHYRKMTEAAAAARKRIMDAGRAALGIEK